MEQSILWVLLAIAVFWGAPLGALVFLLVRGKRRHLHIGRRVLLTGVLWSAASIGFVLNGFRSLPPGDADKNMMAVAMLVAGTAVFPAVSVCLVGAIVSLCEGRHPPKGKVFRSIEDLKMHE